MGTVYFVNGFLEAGKTTFIKELLKRESFRIRGKTLILCCEEGDNEYEEEELAASGAVWELILEEKDFNEDHIAEIEERHRPERIIVEYNGMWDRKDLEFPTYWDDVMEIAVIDATTYRLYSENMRPLLAEQVRRAELAVFYKADEVREELASFARSIRALNNRAVSIFRGAEGDIVLGPDEILPYDIRAEELILDEAGFAVMCMDSVERYELYEGKRVRFTACIYKMKDGGDLEFIAGRQIMTCCETDMTFAGIICGYEKAYELTNLEWGEISGILRTRYDDIAERNITVLRVTGLKKAKEPEKRYITLI